MSLFNFFRKKQPLNRPPENDILLAMPLFTEGRRYSLDAVCSHLTAYWGLPMPKVTGDEESAVLDFEGEVITLSFMPAPVPWEDIEGTAQYAYNWPDAATELRDHTGHAIVSGLYFKQPPLQRYQLFSKVICSLLATSSAAGVYQGMQSLLIPAAQYLSYQEELRQEQLPVLVPLWIYIGLRKNETGHHAYTFGLKAFGKPEMEILDSREPLDELYEFLANICAYIIANDIIFKAGQTLGYTAEQKVRIRFSKGRWVEGETFKLEL